MSLLVIWCSPNQEGLTAKCKSALVKGILEYGMECSEVHLNRLNIGRCQVCSTGFGQCAQQGSCVMEDDFNRLYTLMQQCDALALVTPVYWHDMAEPLKALLDRVRRCDCKVNHALNGKKAMIVACAGGSGNGAIRCLGLMEDTLKHMGMDVRERLPVTRFSAEYMPKAIQSAAWHLCCELNEKEKRPPHGKDSAGKFRRSLSHFRKPPPSSPAPILPSLHILLEKPSDRRSFMPCIYLSPSTQEGNPYVIGGTEEYYMNLLADELVPYLRPNTIRYTRNTPDMTAVSSVRQANEGNYDFYLALHSNAAGTANSGRVRGSLVFYYPTSQKGRRAAEIFAGNLRLIYPLPSLVRTVPTTTLYEVARSKAPANLVEVAYHDNREDAQWITENLPAIASNLAVSLTQYFGLPFIVPGPEWWGTVAISSGSLNIRSRPGLTASVITRAYRGDKIQVLGHWNGWYSVDYNGTLGYASACYIR